MRIPASPTGRLLELDALRGLAALAVGLYHLTYFVPFEVPGLVQASVRIWWGCFGVQLFFAISGFVILGTLERTRDLTAFARSRAKRLLPEYWLAMVLTATIVRLFGPERLWVDPSTWVFNLAPVHDWTNTRMVDGVYWSLNVEIGFYALITLAHRLGWTRRVERLVIGWLATKWLLASVAAPPWIILLLLPEHAPYFAVGMVCWRIHTGERTTAEQVPVLGAIVATAWMLSSEHFRWLTLGLVPLFLLLATGRMTWIARPSLLWMGRLSYPFYLLHAVIGYTILFRLQGAGVNPDFAVAVALVGTVLIAWAMTVAVERVPSARVAPAGPVLLPA